MSLNMRRAFPAIFFLILGTPLAHADVRLEVEVGFHGVFQLGHPFPVTVIVTNLGGPVEGVLEIKVWKGGAAKVTAPYPLFHQKEIFLAARSRRRVSFTVHPDSMARPLEVIFYGAGGRVRRELDLRGHFSPTPLILLATRNATLLAVPLADKSHVPVVSLPAEELPSDTRAYRGVSAVVLYEQSLGGLSDFQRQALENWIHSGGRFVVLGGLHYAVYQEASLSALLPVRVAGLKQVADLPNLGRRYGHDLPHEGDLWVQDAEVVEGEVLIADHGSPIVAAVGRGRGKVFYLALDVGRPPMSRWAGLSLLFSTLLGEPQVSRPGPSSEWNEYVFSRFLSESTLFDAGMSAAAYVVCLLVYAGGLAVHLWLWMHRPAGRTIVAAGFVAFVTVVTFAGYVYFERGSYRMDGLLVISNVLEGAPEGYSRVQSDVGLFATRRKKFQLNVQRGWSDLELVQPRMTEAKPPSLVIEEGMRSTRISVQSKEWNYRLLKIRTMRSFPVRVQLAGEGNRLSIDLANESGQNLTDCWLIVFGNGYPLGDVPNGSRLRRELVTSREEKRVEGLGQKVPLKDISFRQKGREVLFRSSIFPQGRASFRGGEQEAFFLGWIEDDAGTIGTDDPSLLRFNYSMFRLAVPLELEEDL